MLTTLDEQSLFIDSSVGSPVYLATLPDHALYSAGDDRYLLKVPCNCQSASLRPVPGVGVWVALGFENAIIGYSRCWNVDVSGLTDSLLLVITEAADGSGCSRYMISTNYFLEMPDQAIHIWEQALGSLDSSGYRMQMEELYVSIHMK